MRVTVAETIIKINMEELDRMIDEYRAINGANPYLIMNAYTNNYI